MCQRLTMYEQSCDLWKGKNVLKQFESNIFKCNALMLSILSFYLHYFTFLTVTFETCNNIDSKTKKLFILNEKF